MVLYTLAQLQTGGGAITTITGATSNYQTGMTGVYGGFSKNIWAYSEEPCYNIKVTRKFLFRPLELEQEKKFMCWAYIKQIYWPSGVLYRELFTDEAEYILRYPMIPED